VKGYLYILKSGKNGRYYVGSSINPERRLLEKHNKGLVAATKYLVPWKIVFKQEYGEIKIARQVEYKLKTFKSKVILEKIIISGVCNIVPPMN
jgi:predicted GIY-YIG superfamily endonuclease